MTMDGAKSLILRRMPASESQGKFVGDTSGIDRATLDHQRRMYTISDLIISSNYFKQ